jgi:hypothetical protein
MTTRRRYLVGQKLSDYQVEKIIRAYAEGILASDFVAEQARSRSPRAPNTIYEIYHLVRSRLFEIGFYPKFDDVLEAMRDTEYADGFVFSAAARRLGDQANRLQGVNERMLPAHLGEILFRAKNPDLTPEGYFLDIKRVIKLTGPLNRPPQNRRASMELIYILTVQRQIEGMRRMRVSNEEGHRELIKGLEGLIVSAEKRLTQAKRAKAEHTELD